MNKTRLEYTVEKIEEIKAEEDRIVNGDVRFQFGIDRNHEHYCDDQPCEECENWCSKSCKKINNSKRADEWADGLNNIDDALEEKFRHK